MGIALRIAFYIVMNSIREQDATSKCETRSIGSTKYKNLKLKREKMKKNIVA